MTASYRTRPETVVPLGRPLGRRASSHPARPTAERLEARALMTGYYPAVADYNGDGVDDISALRYTTSGTQQVYGRNALLIQTSGSGAFNGSEMGLSATDKPTPADFSGTGKADPAVYGFLNNVSYGNYYGTTTAPGVAQPFPNGSGRFAYIPSNGVYPAHNPGAVNGTFGLDVAKVVIVNIGQEGDLPAVADYGGDGKADFAVYEPSKAQFLYYDSATFDPNADPTLPGNAPKAVPLGNVGDVPASADYQGVGHAQFAVYDAASGTFFVRPSDGGPTITAKLGGPGDIPVSADFEGIGHADYAVYDPRLGVFLVTPSDGSATRTVAIGSPGDIPVPGKFGDGRVDFGTYNPSTQQFQFIQFPKGVFTRSLGDPDAIPVERTDDYSVNLHAEYDARTLSPAVMFLGDSISYFWPSNGPDSWQGRINQFNPSDNGDVYDSTQNLLWRIANGELDKVHPRVVVLEIGTNDLLDRTPAQIAHTILVIMDQIHARSPGTSILLLDVLPRGEISPSDPLGVQQYDAAAASEIRDLNENYIPRLAQPFGSRNTGTYPSGDYSLDLRSSLSINPGDPNNYLANPNDFIDLIHPDKVGYELFASAIAHAAPPHAPPPTRPRRLRRRRQNRHRRLWAVGRRLRRPAFQQRDEHLRPLRDRRRRAVDPDFGRLRRRRQNRFRRVRTLGWRLLRPALVVEHGCLRPLRDQRRRPVDPGSGGLRRRWPDRPRRLRTVDRLVRHPPVEHEHRSHRPVRDQRRRAVDPGSGGLRRRR